MLDPGFHNSDTKLQPLEGVSFGYEVFYNRILPVAHCAINEQFESHKAL